MITIAIDDNYQQGNYNLDNDKDNYNYNSNKDNIKNNNIDGDKNNNTKKQDVIERKACTQQAPKILQTKPTTHTQIPSNKDDTKLPQRSI